MLDKQYKYGIFARIRRGWTVDQVKMYMDQNDIHHTHDLMFLELN